MLSVDAPWKFVEWLDRTPNAERRPVRNAILYFMFPDSLERNVSNDHRRQIVQTFEERLTQDERPKGKPAALLELDRAIFSLRKGFEKELGTTQLDFYRPPISQVWWTGLREKVRKQIASELKNLLSKYGHELAQCGNKKPKLSDCYPVDTSTGFWSDPSDATNKPLRWLVQLEVTGEKIVAKVAGALGDRRIAFANTAQGNTGAVSVRVVPAIKLKNGGFAFYDTWEWLLIFTFMPVLAAGSSGQLIEFDPATGVLKYLAKEQRYVSASLIALNDEEDVYSAAEVARPLRYGDATAALAALIRITAITALDVIPQGAPHA
jgi:hypothetical protein